MLLFLHNPASCLLRRLHEVIRVRDDTSTANADVVCCCSSELRDRKRDCMNRFFCSRFYLQGIFLKLSTSRSVSLVLQAHMCYTRKIQSNFSKYSLITNNSTINLVFVMGVLGWNLAPNTCTPKVTSICMNVSTTGKTMLTLDACFDGIDDAIENDEDERHDF